MVNNKLLTPFLLTIIMKLRDKHNAHIHEQFIDQLKAFHFVNTTYDKFCIIII